MILNVAEQVQQVATADLLTEDADTLTYVSTLFDQNCLIVYGFENGYRSKLVSTRSGLPSRRNAK